LLTLVQMPQSNWAELQALRNAPEWTSVLLVCDVSSDSKLLFNG